MDMFMLALLTLAWVWLLRPDHAERTFRPTKTSSEDIWTALLAPGSGDLVAATTATRREDDRRLMNMRVGERGFVAAQAAGYDYAGALWLRTEVRVERSWTPQTPLSVERAAEGFRVKGPVDEELRVDLASWLRGGAIIPALRAV